jgi:hypothetical protein
MIKRMKSKTPEQLAKEESEFSKFTLYLHEPTMKYLKQRALKAGTSLSKVVNQAILAYAAGIKDQKND